MQPSAIDLNVWITRLQRAADLTLGRAPGQSSGGNGAALPDPNNFRDEAGHRRHVDAPFLAAVTGKASVCPQVREGAQVDELLWHAVCENFSLDRVTALLRQPGSAAGPLFGEAFAGTVEVFTETQLCAMHALHRLAVTHNRPQWLDLVYGTCRWIEQNMQPDNATNHPWAAHVFLMSDAAGVTSGGVMYADTMLMNCQVQQGRPDALSAWILRDAVARLKLAGAGAGAK